MKEYPKIETLFNRDEKFKLTSEVRSPVFATIKSWVVTEKIDGTNIRINLDENDVVTFNGRTDNAQIPAELAIYIVKEFTAEKLKVLRKDEDKVSITLYGEGYGAGIQKGGGDYRKDKGFILFDVLIADKYWLDDEAVTEIADKLGIPRVPILGIMSFEELVSYVKQGFKSKCAETERNAEGIVARPLEPLFDKRLHRVIIKLKEKDFT